MDFIRAARIFRFGSVRKLQNNDFFSDRISHRHTTSIILVFIVLVTFKRLFSNPINCWIPAELRRYEKYINRYCWIKGTYYVNQNYDLNVLSIEARDETLLYYYQWVYIFLLLQAGLFYFPKVLWFFLSSRLLDYDLINLVDAAKKHEFYGYDQKRIIDYLCSNVNHQYTWLTDANKKISKHIQDKIEQQEENSMTNIDKFREYVQLRIHKFRKSGLTISYLFVKVLYLMVAIFQIYFMNRFLSNKKNAFYGLQILKTILSGQADLVHQSDSKIFPRVTICDIRTKELSTDHLYTVQCILSFNLFNERISC